jgi:hypothetical protein
VLQFIVLAIGLDMLDMFCSSHLLVNMINLISMFLIIFFLLSLWIKYHGKLLIFPTIQKPYFRQLMHIKCIYELRSILPHIYILYNVISLFYIYFRDFLNNLLSFGFNFV